MTVRQIYAFTVVLVAIMAGLSAGWSFWLRDVFVAAVAAGDAYPWSAAERWAFVGVVSGLTMLALVAPAGMAVRQAAGREAVRRALAQSEARFRALVELAPDAVLIERGGRVAYVNPTAHGLFAAADPADLVGRPMADLLDADSRDVVERSLDAVAAGRPSDPLTGLRIVRADGSPVEVEMVAGQTIFMGEEARHVVIRDVSDRRRAEGRLRDAIESLDEGFTLWDADDRLVMCNERVRDIYAPLAGTLVPGRTFEENFRAGVETGLFVVPPGRDPEDWIQARIDGHREPGGPIERRLSDGRVLRIVEQKTSEGGVVSVTIDVTETVAAQNALKDNERRFRDFAESSSDWFWEMGPDLRFSRFSGRVREILDVSPEDLVGRSRDEVAMRFDDPRESAAWRRHLEDLDAHRPFRNFTYTLRDARGRLHTVMISGAPVFGDDGTFQGYRGTGTDITAETEAERRAAEAHEQLRDAVDSASDGFALWDADDRLVLVNSRLTDMFPNLVAARNRGLTFEESLRLTVDDGLLAGIGETKLEAETWIAEHVSRHAKPGEPFEIQTKDGRWLLVNERKTANGLTVGTYTDITRRKKDEEQLLVLSSAVEQSPASVLITNPEGIILYVNRRFVQNTGFSREEAVGHKANLTKSGTMPDEFYADLWQTIRTGREWQGEFLNRRKNGEMYWEDALISPIVSPTGKISHFVSVQEDVTLRKRSEEKLRSGAEQLRAILEASPIAVGVTPRSDPTLIFGNSRFAELFGLGHWDLVGGDTTEFMIKTSERIAVLRTLEREGVVRDLEVHRRHPDGSDLWYLLSAEPIEFEDEEEAVLWWAYDITEQKLVREQLAKLAHHDTLTGLANRRLFIDHLQRAIARTRRADSTGALLYFDLDGFKKVNDTLGHRFGDWLLEEAAKRLRGCVRESDLVSRIGGDEFTLVIENVASADAVEAVAAKVLTSLSQPFDHDGETARVGVSIGIAYFDGSETEPETLIVRADRAMYRAKRAGKGMTKVYDPAVDGVSA